MKKTLAILFLGVSLTGYSQKLKVIEGDLSVLKGQTAVKTEFTYDNMTVTNKNVPEAEFIETKKGEYEKKEAGRGEKFATAWVDDRASRFEPKFRELFAEHSKMTTTDESAKYTLIFHTTHTETGYNIGISKRPAYIDGEAFLVETADKSKVVAKLTIENVPGSQFGGYDYDTGTRLAECYAKAGKDIGKAIGKAAKK
jgi:hypothetical protein